MNTLCMCIRQWSPPTTFCQEGVLKLVRTPPMENREHQHYCQYKLRSTTPQVVLEHNHPSSIYEKTPLFHQ